ncbi:SAM-dependent methyltransferase, partial [Dissulfurirhabdus thermomarina]
TSPHVHPLFGALCARQLLDFRSRLGGGPFRVVEQGAGAGYLAADILGYLERKAALDGVTYVVVEPFEHLKALQAERLERYGDRVRWVGAAAELSPAPGCVLTNELLDAFPVHLVVREADGFREVYVDWEGGAFREVTGPPSSPELAAEVAALPADLPPGYRTEINLEARRWLREAAGGLDRGFVLTVDYGFTRREYLHPARSGGTLLAYGGHRAFADVLQDPGTRDITAHVNFTDLARWGRRFGLQPLGYAPQWSFLASLDVEAALRDLDGGPPPPFSPQAAAVKMLLLPQGMGDSHKVFVQGKAVAAEPVPAGFRLRNLVHRLEEEP